MKLCIQTTAALLLLTTSTLSLAFAADPPPPAAQARAEMAKARADMEGRRAEMAKEHAEMAKKQVEMGKARAEMDKKRADMEKTRAELQELRQQMGGMAKRLADLSRQLGEPAPQAFAYRYLSDPDAGSLGLVMIPDGQHLVVEAVTPGSPAEDAGITHGDRIVRVDGKNIASKGALRLKAFSDIKADQDVKLVIDRKGKQRKVSLKAERREMPAWSSLLEQGGTWHSKDMPRLEIERSVQNSLKGLKQQRVLLRHMAPWWGLNLVSLNKDLGSYFGTDKGALLLGSDKDSLPGLKAGDVITRIGKQTINRPEDAMRALTEHGKETVTASIVRHGKTLQVKLKLPANPMLIPPPPPAPPAPPQPPAPVHSAAPPAPPTPPSAPRPPPRPTATLAPNAHR